MKLKKLLTTNSIILLCFLPFLSIKAQVISGAVHTAQGEAMEGITIKVNGEAVSTGLDGLYIFLNLASATNYTIKPTKEELDPMNGVNTFDIVVIRRHILGLVPFESPYQKIAADVNGSGTITTFDVVKLRRMILRLDDDFGDLEPWRFVDANYEMNDTALAQVPDFPEERYLDALVAGLSSIDFTGIKLGDVNFSASPNFNQDVEERNNETLQIAIEREIEDNYTTLTFQANDFQDITAFQFTFNFSVEDLEFLHLTAGELENFAGDNVGLKFQEAGKLTIAWQDVAAVTLENGRPLFQLIFKNKIANVREKWCISSDLTPALAFKTNGEAFQLKSQQLANQVAIENMVLDNFPNPFHDQTMVRFSLLEAGAAALTILNNKGQILKTIQGDFSKGNHEILVNRQDLNGHRGMLFLQLRTNNEILTKKIMLN